MKEYEVLSFVVKYDHFDLEEIKTMLDDYASKGYHVVSTAMNTLQISTSRSQLLIFLERDIES